MLVDKPTPRASGIEELMAYLAQEYPFFKGSSYEEVNENSLNPQDPNNLD